MATLSYGFGTGRRVARVTDSRDETLGTDVSALPSLGSRFRLVSGPENLAEALARRLMTPRGALHYAPDYGTDLRAFLSEAFTARTITRVRAAVEAELRKDRRVTAVSAVATYDATTESLAVEVVVENEAGPFTLTVRATALTVELLAVES